MGKAKVVISYNTMGSHSGDLHFTKSSDNSLVTGLIRLNIVYGLHFFKGSVSLVSM